MSQYNFFPYLFGGRGNDLLDKLQNLPISNKFLPIIIAVMVSEWKQNVRLEMYY